MVVQCCCCKRLRRDGQWIEVDSDYDPNTLSHGYCPSCESIALLEVEEYVKK